MPVAWNTVLVVAGRTPLSPDDALDAADRAFAEDGDAPRAQALALAAIDRSPAYRDAHEVLANVLGPGPEGDDALRRALRLEPWCVPGRDELAFRLWRRGERDAAAAELEESFARFPYLVSHAFLGPDAELTPGRRPVRRARARRRRHAAAHLARLDPHAGRRHRARARPGARASAGGRGARRASSPTSSPCSRRASAGPRPRTAARRGAPRQPDDASLAHAARNYLKANDPERAEEALLAALLRNPERGSLYQRLAVDIYAARGDFALAEKVLEAGERNAVDMLPVYAASADVIAKREQAWTERVAAPSRDRSCRPIEPAR